jgi:Iap family predicted aminopeptidase
MKPPRLIHISKTGGQAISTVALEQAKLRWGMYDEEYGCGMSCHRLLSNIQKKDIIDKHAWFMVVRNPYERMVSQYNWHVTWRKEEIGINEYLSREIADIDSEMNRKGYQFTEQYRYLEEQYNIKVLHFETLEEEFNQFMKEHGYNIVLNKKINVSIKSASLVDLSPETIDMINRVYEKDFTTFGYSMIH